MRLWLHAGWGLWHGPGSDLKIQNALGRSGHITLNVKVRQAMKEETQIEVENGTPAIDFENNRQGSLSRVVGESENFLMPTNVFASSSFHLCGPDWIYPNHY